MNKFAHIGAFHKVVKYVDHVNGDPGCPEKYKIRHPVTFRGTVKLHGANMGVRFENGVMTTQSRTAVITSSRVIRPPELLPLT